MIVIYILLLIIIHIICNYANSYEYFSQDADIFNDINVYAINLAARLNKKEHIKNEFAKTNISGQIIDAIDGRTLDLEKLKLEQLVKIGSEERNLRRGEVGCYMSHLKIWNEFFASDKKYALIFEDDAVLPSDFKTKLNNIFIELKNIDWDVFYLTMNCRRHFGDRCDKIKNITENVQNPEVIGYGLYGYIINKKAAKMLYDQAIPIQYPADVYLSNQQQNNKDLKFIQLKQPLVRVNSYIDSDTMRIQ